MKPDNPLALYKARRARLAALMGEGVAIVATAPERLRNRDSHYPYRFDSYFYYLTGFAEPESVLVLIAGKTPRSILFCRNRDPEREIWDAMVCIMLGLMAEFFTRQHASASWGKRR